MHPRNPYRQRIGFVELARQYPELQSYVNTHTKTIDFRDDDAQRALTRAILKVDFGLEVDLPKDRLCPPVPNRLNYVLWIQDLVEVTRKGRGKALGLDIGTGASAIYPLLACKLKSKWEMVATEIDSTSLSYAQSNVSKNDLQDRIRVVQAASGTDSKIFGPLFDSPSSPTFDFTMCNPPFYSSHTEIQQSQLAKEELPLQACSGSENEMIYPGDSEAAGVDLTRSGRLGKSGSLASAYKKEGGEVAFVAKMVEESVRLGAGKCRWYTSMLGKLSSVPKLVALFREFDIANYAITEFVQGQTRRWALGWSLDGWRLPDTIARLSHLPPTHPLFKVQPQKTTFGYTLPPIPLKDEVLSNLHSNPPHHHPFSPRHHPHPPPGPSSPPSSSASPDRPTTVLGDGAPDETQFHHALERILHSMQQDAGGEGVFRVETTNITTTEASNSTAFKAADTPINASSSMPTSFLVSVEENTWSRSARRKKNNTKGGEENKKRKADEAGDGRRKAGKYRRVEGGVEGQGTGGDSGGGRLLRTDGDDVGKTNSAEAAVGGASSVGEPVSPSTTTTVPAASSSSGSALIATTTAPDNDIPATAQPTRSFENTDQLEMRDKMVCSIQVVPPSQAHTELGPESETNESNSSDSHCLRFQWVYGFDRQMVEGFVSHVGQKVSLAVAESS